MEIYIVLQISENGMHAICVETDENTAIKHKELAEKAAINAYLTIVKADLQIPKEEKINLKLDEKEISRMMFQEMQKLNFCLTKSCYYKMYHEILDANSKATAEEIRKITRMKMLYAQAAYSAIENKLSDLGISVCSSNDQCRNLLSELVEDVIVQTKFYATDEMHRLVTKVIVDNEQIQSLRKNLLYKTIIHGINSCELSANLLPKTINAILVEAMTAESKEAANRMIDGNIHIVSAMKFFIIENLYNMDIPVSVGRVSTLVELAFGEYHKTSNILCSVQHAIESIPR